MADNHPYWDYYSRLTSILGSKSKSRAEAARELGELAGQAGLHSKDRFKLKLLTALPWLNKTAIEEIFFHSLREKFAYSNLSPEMLERLGEYSPLVELGAGNGYLAWLLRQKGCDIVPIDAFPVEEGKNWFFNTNVFSLPTTEGKSFIEVKKGTSEALADYPNHTLLLCWPPINSMGKDALRDFRGSTVIFVGNKKNCGEPTFYKMLKEHWELIFSTKTGSWTRCHTEWMEIYKRKA
jgi:hypothetical protein